MSAGSISLLFKYSKSFSLLKKNVLTAFMLLQLTAVHSVLTATIFQLAVHTSISICLSLIDPSFLWDLVSAPHSLQMILPMIIFVNLMNTFQSLSDLTHASVWP